MGIVGDGFEGKKRGVVGTHGPKVERGVVWGGMTVCGQVRHPVFVHMPTNREKRNEPKHQEPNKENSGQEEGLFHLKLQAYVVRVACEAKRRKQRSQCPGGFVLSASLTQVTGRRGGRG